MRLYCKIVLVTPQRTIPFSRFCIPIKKHFRAFLRGRLTPHWFTVCGNLRTFGDHDLNMIYCYSCQHSHFWYLLASFRLYLFDVQNVLLPLCQLIVRDDLIWKMINVSWSKNACTKYMEWCTRVHRNLTYFSTSIRKTINLEICSLCWSTSILRIDQLSLIILRIKLLTSYGGAGLKLMTDNTIS